MQRHYGASLCLRRGNRDLEESKGNSKYQCSCCPMSYKHMPYSVVEILEGLSLRYHGPGSYTQGWILQMTYFYW